MVGCYRGKGSRVPTDLLPWNAAVRGVSRCRWRPATVERTTHVPLGSESVPDAQSLSPRGGRLPISRPGPQICGTPGTVYWLCRGLARVQGVAGSMACVRVSRRKEFPYGAWWQGWVGAAKGASEWGPSVLRCVSEGEPIRYAIMLPWPSRGRQEDAAGRKGRERVVDSGNLAPLEPAPWPGHTHTASDRWAGRRGHQGPRQVPLRPPTAMEGSCNPK